MSEHSTESAERLSGVLAELYGEAGLPNGLPLNSTSQALEASRVAKSGAGHLFGFSGYNSGAGQFVLAFDAQTTPANGVVPVIVIAAPGSANFSYDAGRWGRVFHQGFVLAVSSTAATLTIASASCWFDIQYI